MHRRKKARGGFGKLQQLSPALSEFLGVESESRAQVVKKIWDYIKANNLQVGGWGRRRGLVCEWEQGLARGLEQGRQTLPAVTRRRK